MNLYFTSYLFMNNVQTQRCGYRYTTIDHKIIVDIICRGNVKIIPSIIRRCISYAYVIDSSTETYPDISESLSRDIVMNKYKINGHTQFFSCSERVLIENLNLLWKTFSFYEPSIKQTVYVIIKKKITSQEFKLLSGRIAMSYIISKNICSDLPVNYSKPWEVNFENLSVSVTNHTFFSKRMIISRAEKMRIKSIKNGEITSLITSNEDKYSEDIYSRDFRKKSEKLYRVLNIDIKNSVFESFYEVLKPNGELCSYMSPIKKAFSNFNNEAFRSCIDTMSNKLKESILSDIFDFGEFPQCIWNINYDEDLIEAMCITSHVVDKDESVKTLMQIINKEIQNSFIVRNKNTIFEAEFRKPYISGNKLTICIKFSFLHLDKK